LKKKRLTNFKIKKNNNPRPDIISKGEGNRGASLVTGGGKRKKEECSDFERGRGRRMDTMTASLLDY